MRAVALALLVLLASAVPAVAKTKPTDLRAGAGQADITPPKTGYYLGGWTRADRLAKGQSTRLFANTLVLQRGSKKVALVAAELFSIAGGMQEDVAREVKDIGFDVETVVLAASHTHSGPGGFSNNPTYNTAAPSTNTISDPASFVALLNPAPADRQLYTFLVKQIAQSIRRANADRHVAVAGWGHTRLFDLTQNRSIEAHLADHGIHEELGHGHPEQDPNGVGHTIDPIVDVLRVDKLVQRKRKCKRKKGVRPRSCTRTVRVPIGAYSNFADHGTVVKSETELYSGDHHAAAWRVFADRVRKVGKVPGAQTIVNVYPNGAEGDQTAGLQHTGIEGAIEVGTKEAESMFNAWQTAGQSLSRTPALDVRWTRSCFCGRQTATGPVDSKGVVGAGFLTGSEEGRGPLYDITHVPLEGQKNPNDDPVQGPKYGLPIGNPPPAIPLAVIRIGDGVLATIPGEPTKEVGVRVRSAVEAGMAGSGIKTVTIAGLANDFIQYITTPEEYGEQSYEGASTLYGRNQATFMQERLGELGKALVEGKPALAPYPFDSSYGVKPDGIAFPQGADSATIDAQPLPDATRGATVKLAWTGGPDGADRPVDKAFVTAELNDGKKWRAIDSDLGLNMLWRVDSEGHYTFEWKVPADAPAGVYRLRVTASKYELVSNTFKIVQI
jgi:hypothetical protein